MKKKALSLLLASTMVVSLAACGGNGDTAGDSGTTSSDNSGSTTTTSDNSTAGDSGSGDSSAPGEYVLTDVKIMVNGTVNSVKQETEAQQTARDAFIPQLEAAVGEAIGHEINIEFEVASHSDYSGYVGRMFVSEQYPDVMIMSADMLKQYEKTGLLWDMASAYDNAEFQSRLKLPGINEGLKDSEGHLYGFAPTYGNGCITYVKQAWLDNLGINGDDIKTYDDFYNMLVRFSTEDPDGNGVDGDTYGFISAGLIGSEAPWINYVAEFWQGAYPSIIQGDDGVWYDGFQTPEAKEALLRMQKAYQDGVIDPDSFT
ncbi:MAG: ABC transporter substrate-binding protein, partial [Lachnospiraceae bacterium]|nr:ABC transporter substrate-binding protein [Lachnospiraceae bacterium]